MSLRAPTTWAAGREVAALVHRLRGVPVSNKSGCYPRVTLATTPLGAVRRKACGRRRTLRGMTWRRPVVLVLTAVLAAAPVALAAPGSAPLVVSGRGGQSAVLTVPRGGLDVVYPVL